MADRKPRASPSAPRQAGAITVRALFEFGRFAAYRCAKRREFGVARSTTGRGQPLTGHLPRCHGPCLFRRRLRSALRQSWPLRVSVQPCRGAPYPPRPGQPSARAKPAGRLSPAGDGARAAPAPATPEAGGLVRGCHVGIVKTALVLRSTAKIGYFSCRPWVLVRQHRCCAAVLRGWCAQGLRCAPAMRPATSSTRPLSPRPGGLGLPRFQVLSLSRPALGFWPVALRRSPSWARGRGRLVVAVSCKVKTLTCRAASRHDRYPCHCPQISRQTHSKTQNPARILPARILLVARSGRPKATRRMRKSDFQHEEI